jgi:CheY-like chemotaxis protein
VGPVPRYMRRTGSPHAEKVLVVEDEPLIQVLATEALEDAGFEVLAAWNADEALRILERHGDEVGVLFSDVNMPGRMDGVELAETVHERWPHIRFLLSSGLARPAVEAIPDDGRFLPKPYDSTTVVRHVRELSAA